MARPQDEILASIRRRLGNPPKQRNELLLALYEAAVAKFHALTRLPRVPAKARPLLVEMVVVAYNRVKSEGLHSQSLHGAAESYLDGLPDDLTAAIMACKPKKLKVLG